MNEAAALDALRAILARPELNQRPSLGLWDVLWAAIWSAAIDFLSWVSSPVRDALAGHVNWVEVLVTLAALAIIAAAGWYVVRAVRFSLVREAVSAQREAAARRERSERLWSEAQSLAAAGRLAEATRALYLSALYALEEHDLLSVEAALTNREHVERLEPSRPGTRAALAAIVQRYEPLRYGRHPITPEAFAELSGLVQQARVAA